MTKPRIEVNGQALRDLMKSSEMHDILGKKARAIAVSAGSAGGEFRTEVKNGKTRARATIWAHDREAKKQEATNRSLTRAMDAGR